MSCSRTPYRAQARQSDAIRSRCSAFHEASMSGVEQMETTVGGSQSGSWLHVLLAAGNQTRRVPTLLQTRNPDSWVHQKRDHEAGRPYFRTFFFSFRLDSLPSSRAPFLILLNPRWPVPVNETPRDSGTHNFPKREVYFVLQHEPRNTVRMRMRHL